MKFVKLAGYSSSASNWLKMGKKAAKHLGIKLPKIKEKSLMKTRKYRAPSRGR